MTSLSAFPQACHEVRAHMIVASHEEEAAQNLLDDLGTPAWALHKLRKLPQDTAFTKSLLDSFKTSVGGTPHHLTAQHVRVLLTQSPLFQL